MEVPRAGSKVSLERAGDNLSTLQDRSAFTVWVGVGGWSLQGAFPKHFSREQRHKIHSTSSQPGAKSFKVVSSELVPLRHRWGLLFGV